MTKKMSDYQNIIALSRYARWIDDKGRRETWEETVHRLLDFYKKFLKDKHSVTLSPEIYAELYTAIVTLNVMPSMRAMMTAGPALERNHIAAYNCAYLNDNIQMTCQKFQRNLRTVKLQSLYRTVKKVGIEAIKN